MTLAWLLACTAESIRSAGKGDEEEPTSADGGCDSVEQGAGSRTWHADADGDSFGTRGAVAGGCEPPEGYVEDSTDCDDGDPTVHPGATEQCGNGVDGNCDGTADEGGIPTWYHDADGDGYGTSPTASCDQPTTHTDRAGDCDDADAAVHPGATEVCGNERDDDCDGNSVDPCESGISLGLADARFTGESAEDRAGLSLAAAGDVNSDGHDDILVGGFVNDGGGPDAGAAYLLLGGESLVSRSLSAADARLTGELPGGHAGFTVAGAGDVDADGYDDLIVATFHEEEGEVGAAYLVLGRPFPASASLADADARFTGESTGAYQGFVVSGAGDVDGDGHDDVLVGAYAHGDRLEGFAYLVLGAPTVSSIALSAAHGQLLGEGANHMAGSAVSGAGDVDGDGLDDVLVGAPGNHDGANRGGAAYLIRGDAEPLVDSLAAADAQYTGEGNDDYAGSAVSGAGDVDADGYDDVVVGAYGHDDAGVVYLVRGGPAVASGSLADADARFDAEGWRDSAGYALSGGGDLDADGHADFLIGAPFHGGSERGGNDAGAAYVVFGAPALASASLAASAETFLGESEFDAAGCSVATAGDVDADGYDDVLVGAYLNDAGGENAGAAYLSLGGSR